MTMTDFDQMAARITAALRQATAARGEPRTRNQALMLLTTARAPRRPRAAAAAGVARLDLDDEIGVWGISAADFIAQLRGVTAGTIELHISSPGGDVFDGIAMYNALRDHPARVEVVVNSLAASAASFIAMAGDTVKMNRAASLMIHEAMTVTGGNEADHLRSAELLGRVSDTIAGLYAGRAGGTVAEWRERMRAETWYSPAEAVEAGLADEAVEDDPAAGVDPAALANAIRLAFQ